MRGRDYFPLGLALGEAFCNRTEETQLLVDNIQHGKHTLLMATRRYGKSSLALKAIQQSGQPSVEVDFYMASSEKVVEGYLLSGAVELIGKALGSIEKMTASIKKYVKTLKPKLVLGSSTFKLELTPETDSDPASNVKEALLLLEGLLAEKKKHAVFLMDEFQNVGIIAEGRGIEAAIRHVAQKTKYLTIIFSGSNRKLLQTMFEDENRPLYKLCHKITIKRMSVSHYTKHIQTAANAAWKKHLSDEALNAIFILSERHPFYVNKLCDRLWQAALNQPPSAKDVQTMWTATLQEEKSDAVKEISLLSPGQKNLLLMIAKGHIDKMTGKDAILELKMTSSSIVTALEGLEEKDMIEKNEEGYHIISPVVRYFAFANPLQPSGECGIS